MLCRVLEVITLAIVLQQCDVRAQAACSVSEVCCPDDDCSKIAYGEAGLQGPKGNAGGEGPHGFPGVSGEKGDKGSYGMRGQDGQKGEKGDSCSCKTEGPGDAQAGSQKGEMPSVNGGLFAAICLLYVLVLVIVAAMVFLTWKNKTTMDTFQKVLLSLAERENLNIQDQNYTDLDQGQREPTHKYDQLSAHPPPNEDNCEGFTYEDPASSAAYIEPLPPLTSEAYIEPLPPLNT
ncbi:uncharacterized protein LOC110443607 isoform X2 [Mizuhopecten yessoensis]|uniref:uncharacterized protein LOC110443607 isoform X2 n=1 Tax=Mizuhopecten yessoensis TaxID=6573 RepID=UPI000B45DFEC|nr:uncharacterized protein LOC110443607 isoform X2 [Mizuhopecten yessoensis]